MWVNLECFHLNLRLRLVEIVLRNKLKISFTDCIYNITFGRGKSSGGMFSNIYIISVEAQKIIINSYLSTRSFSLMLLLLRDITLATCSSTELLKKTTLFNFQILDMFKLFGPVA
jgi:hypothetical protein